MQKNDSPITVVVTRPTLQAHHLCTTLMNEGFAALSCPTIDIVPVTPSEVQLAKLRNNTQQIMPFASIFTSVNAVYYAFTWFKEKQYSFDAQHWLAVGSATQAALATNISDKKEIVVAQPNNSEGMLALALLQEIKGKKIFLFKGVDGRQLLADSLKKRGAEVESIEVYRREAPAKNKEFSRFNDMLSSPLRGKIVVLITSVSSLTHLIQNTDKKLYPVLLELPLIVASSRIASEAHILGFKRPAIVADTANDEAMIRALKKNISIL